MNLAELSSEPQLIKVIIDNEVIVKEFSPDGTPLEFYTWDRQPLDVILKLGNSLGVDQKVSIETLKTLILNDKGEVILTGTKQFPMQVMVAAMAKVMELLGK